MRSKAKHCKEWRAKLHSQRMLEVQQHKRGY